jgi:hypothetical protein
MFVKNQLVFLKFLGVFWLIIGFSGCFSPEKEPSQNPLQITNNLAPDSSAIIPEIDDTKLETGDTTPEIDDEAPEIDDTTPEIDDETSETAISKTLELFDSGNLSTVREKTLFATLLELFPDSFPTHKPTFKGLPAYRRADNYMNQEVRLRLFYPRWDNCAYLGVVYEDDKKFGHDDHFYLFKKIDSVHWKVIYEYEFNGGGNFELKNQLLEIYEGHEYEAGEYSSSISVHRIEKDTLIEEVIGVSADREDEYLDKAEQKSLSKIHPSLQKIQSRYSSYYSNWTAVGNNKLFIKEEYEIGLKFDHQCKGKPFKFYNLLLNSPEYPCQNSEYEDDFYLELIHICIQKTLVWDAKKYAYVQVSQKVKNGNYPTKFLEDLSSYQIQYHHLKKKYPKIAQQIYTRANKAQKAGLDAWLLMYENDN